MQVGNIFVGGWAPWRYQAAQRNGGAAAAISNNFQQISCVAPAWRFVLWSARYGKDADGPRLGERMLPGWQAGGVFHAKGLRRPL